MTYKIFRNRITQETDETISKLKRTFIDMNTDKPMTPETPHGLFALTLEPNVKVDSVKLEHDFNSILSHYYHWKYSSKWRKLKNIQNIYWGIIEKQVGGYNHIHITINQFNIEEVAIFAGYIIRMFKTMYSRASHRLKRVYDIKGWNEYTSPEKAKKDKYSTSKRIEPPTYISSVFFEIPNFN